MRICTNQVRFFAMNGLLQDIFLWLNSDFLMAALLREFISWELARATCEKPELWVSSAGAKCKVIELQNEKLLRTCYLLFINILKKENITYYFFDIFFRCTATCSRFMTPHQKQYSKTLKKNNSTNTVQFCALTGRTIKRCVFGLPDHRKSWKMLEYPGWSPMVTPTNRIFLMSIHARNDAVWPHAKCSCLDVKPWEPNWKRRRNLRKPVTLTTNWKKGWSFRVEPWSFMIFFSVLWGSHDIFSYATRASLGHFYSAWWHCLWQLPMKPLGSDCPVPFQSLIEFGCEAALRCQSHQKGLCRSGTKNLRTHDTCTCQWAGGTWTLAASGHLYFSVAALCASYSSLQLSSWI